MGTEESVSNRKLAILLTEEYTLKNALVRSKYFNRTVNQLYSDRTFTTLLGNHL